jgi:hypothetical protein
LGETESLTTTTKKPNNTMACNPGQITIYTTNPPTCMDAPKTGGSNPNKKSAFDWAQLLLPFGLSVFAIEKTGRDTSGRRSEGGDETDIPFQDPNKKTPPATPPGGMDTKTIAMIGGGVVVLAAIIYFLKPKAKAA